MSQREDGRADVRAACDAASKAMHRLAGALCVAACMVQSAIAQTILGVTAQGAASLAPVDPAVQTIRARLAQRLSGLPKIDEISTSGMPGVYEVRLGNEVYYSDAQGNYLIRGELIDTRSQRNLTRERLDKLSAIDFDKLPLQDAILWKSGAGKRRIAVFADPNCPYCKRLESELQNLDVSVYTFLYPILAPDSTTKSQAIWCNADASQSWKQWMLNGTAPATGSNCANPIERNLALGKAHRIDGLPAVIFEDGFRSPGLVSAAQIEQRMAGSAVR